jgi:hypothetical protein
MDEMGSFYQDKLLELLKPLTRGKVYTETE